MRRPDAVNPINKHRVRLEEKERAKDRKDARVMNGEAATTTAAASKKKMKGTTMAADPAPQI